LSKASTWPSGPSMRIQSPAHAGAPLKAPRIRWASPKPVRPRLEPRVDNRTPRSALPPVAVSTRRRECPPDVASGANPFDLDQRAAVPKPAHRERDAGQEKARDEDEVQNGQEQADGRATPHRGEPWMSDRSDDAHCRMHGLTGVFAFNCGQTTVRMDGFPFSDTIFVPQFAK
jgi:hypothetical protein